MKQKREDLHRTMAGEDALHKLAVDGCGGSPEIPPTTPDKPTRRGLPTTPQSDLPATEKDVESPVQPVEESPLRPIPREGWGQGFSSPEFEQQSPQRTDGYGTPSPEKEAFPKEDFFNIHIFIVIVC